MLANILISGFFFSIDLFLLALAAALRLFPSLLKSTRTLLQEFMNLSYKLYQFILGEVAPYLHRWWGFNILVGSLRVFSSMVLSLILGMLLLWIFGFSFTVFSVALCILHGIVVGIVWGKVNPHSEGFRMGVDVE